MVYRFSRLSRPLFATGFASTVGRQSNKLFQTAKRFNTVAVPGVWQTIRTSPNTWAKYAGGAACLGLGGLVAYGLSQPASYVPSQTRTTMRQFGGPAFAQRVRQRMGATYGYVTAGLGITAASAMFFFSRGIAARMAMMNPWMALGVSFVGMMGTMMVCRATPQDNVLLKHSTWLLFNAAVGLSLCPIAMMASAQIVKQAAMITGCVVGGLSAVAAASPGDGFLNTGPYLGAGLGMVVAASLGSMIFPASGLLMNVSLYGGLGLFGLFVCHDTARMQHNAEIADEYDSINEGFGLYMDTINIFVRVVQILVMMQGGRRR